MDTISDSCRSTPEGTVAVRTEEDAEPVAEEAGGTRGGEVPELRDRRVTLKPRYRPLQTGGLQESDYDKYFSQVWQTNQTPSELICPNKQNRRNYRQNSQVSN